MGGPVCIDRYHYRNSGGSPRFASSNLYFVVVVVVVVVARYYCRFTITIIIIIIPRVPSSVNCIENAVMFDLQRLRLKASIHVYRKFGTAFDKLIMRRTIPDLLDEVLSLGSLLSRAFCDD